MKPNLTAGLFLNGRSSTAVPGRSDFRRQRVEPVPAAFATVTASRAADLSGSTTTMYWSSTATEIALTSRGALIPPHHYG